MDKLNANELFQALLEILNCNAFELHIQTDSSGSNSILIPYMMNDALECYLLIKGRITGKYMTDLNDALSVELVNLPSDQNSSESSALIFRQGSQNVFTIWFKDAFRVLKCYQYHSIGHFWVNGAEHWRRLVYIIGTIYDKYEYMGEKICNTKELALLPLMEFGPFHMYSPIHESLKAYYQETKDGVRCMKQLAAKVHDKSYLLLLGLYERFPSLLLGNLLHKALNHPKRQPLYNLINQKITEASSCYPKRSYTSELNAEISAARHLVSETLASAGFTGSYPLFQKGSLQVSAMEEHPFTILEAQDFSFRIQFMISETSENPAALHNGFFKKRGNRSRIASDLSFISKM